MKYMIHSYSKRLWYVEKYLIPSMVEQGINESDIYVFNDSNNRGNLQAYLDSVDYILNNEKLYKEDGIWHLQDDVIISSDFAKRTLIDNNVKGYTSVINGFASDVMNPEKDGLVNVKYFWYSFPCIYIPNKYLAPFMYFMKVISEKGNDNKYKIRYNKNRYDDYFFYKFLIKVYPTDNMYNLKPNLVDHIDFLLGGSTGERKRQIRSLYFNELDLVKKLERSIKNDLSSNNKEIKKDGKEISNL